MIFGKIFHLSKEGSKAIVQAGIWLALFNLAALLPVILLAMASEKMITLYYADSEAKISLLPYALALAVILAVMFVTYKVAWYRAAALVPTAAIPAEWMCRNRLHSCAAASSPDKG